MEPLFIFMDLEAAHGDVYFGDIIELSAQVDPRVLENEVFDRLINTNQSLTYFCLEVSKITKNMLNSKEYFPKVFTEFLSWIDNVVEKCSVKKTKNFYPVLVAHGGFDMDFMMIQSNMERNEMDLDLLIDHNLHFADTYYFLGKERLNGTVSYLNGSKLSIEGLLKRLFPKDKIVGQHRAMADVKFMIKIFLESPIEKLFNKITIATFKSRHDVFIAKHTSKKETELLNNNLPPDLAKVTHNMTLKRLLRNGITYIELQNLFKSSISFLDFFDRLNHLGIERKAAKSIAARLSSMGLSCSGAVSHDVRNEVGDDDDDVHSQLDVDEDDAGVESKLTEMTISENVQMVRSDSGYASNSIIESEEDLVRFYNMYIDEFFYPPEVYEYLFGSFTEKDIDDMDQFIAELFDSRYPEYFDNPDYKGPQFDEKPTNTNKPDFSALPPLEEERPDVEFGSFYEHIRQMESKKYEQIKTREIEKYKFLPESDEQWDEQMEDYEEFDLATETGRLAKVVPIGMTMDDFSGASLSGKVPLFTHYGDLDMTSRPVGGIPKRKGKAGAKERNRLKRENKKAQKQLNYAAIDDGAHTVVKAKSGEVFVLV